jgi:SAM-dependent MidA family methyltransferase
VVVPGLRIADIIRERGALTVAAFMELALYHPKLGYYARAARRSGRAGDFFTSVDVGPLFGELLEMQLSEMFSILASHGTPLFDLVEAGAGNGRLSADILTAACTHSPQIYKSLRLHLVEVSSAARAAQSASLGNHAGKLTWSGADLPPAFEGVVIANELLDAMPVHQVVMRDDGLHEVYVIAESAAGKSGSRAFDASLEDGPLPAPGADASRTATELALRDGPPSTPALAQYLTRLGVELQPGWRVEINLRAPDWIRHAAERLKRGFIVVIDYGHEARDLYSASHSSGTLTTCRRHRSTGPELAGVPDWLQSPGEQDITSHVDFSTLRATAEAAGLRTLGFLDQTYFLMGLLPPDAILDRGSAPDPGSVARGDPFVPLRSVPPHDAQTASWGPRLAGAPHSGSIRNPQSAIRNLKTLILPGGLGSTHKVMIFGKEVGTPALRGCSYRMRVT